MLRCITSSAAENILMSMSTSNVFCLLVLSATIKGADVLAEALNTRTNGIYTPIKALLFIFLFLHFCTGCVLLHYHIVSSLTSRYQEYKSTDDCASLKQSLPTMQLYMSAVMSVEHVRFKLCLLVHGLNSHLNLFPLKGEPVKRDDIFVAVKTCRKFHSDRGACTTPTLPEHFLTVFFFSLSLSRSFNFGHRYLSSSELNITTMTAYH